MQSEIEKREDFSLVDIKIIIFANYTSLIFDSFNNTFVALKVFSSKNVINQIIIVIVWNLYLLKCTLIFGYI